MQCCTCSKWVHLKCLLLSFSRFRTLGSSHSWSFPPCCVPACSGDPTLTATSSSDSFSSYTSTAQFRPSGPPLLMQHSHPTLAFKSFIFFPPTSYFLLLHPHHRFILLVVFLHLLLPLLPLSASGFFNGMLGVSRARSTEVLLFILSHRVDFICIQ